MHQHMQRARHKAVVDEEVLFQLELRVAALEVSRTIALHAMAQREVLCTGRRADRVGLNETQLLDRPSQSGRLEQRASNGVAAQGVERDRHAAMISKAARCKEARVTLH